MHHLKMLGLAIMAVAALTALLGAGTASATELCSTNTNPCTGTMFGAGTPLKAELAGTAILETVGGTPLDECTGGGVEGTITNTGGTGETVKASIPTAGLTWSGCSRPLTTTTEGGELEIHTDNVEADGNGTLTVKGFTVQIATILGTCTFGFSPTTASDLGTLKGGSPATIEISTIVPRKTGSACPAEARWTAKYKVVEPTSLYVQ